MCFNEISCGFYQNYFIFWKLFFFWSNLVSHIFPSVQLVVKNETKPKLFLVHNFFALMKKSTEISVKSLWTLLQSYLNGATCQTSIFQTEKLLQRYKLATPQPQYWSGVIAANCSILTLTYLAIKARYLALKWSTSLPFKFC